MSTMTAPEPQTPKLTRKDFESDQDVRWCPGCGDYSILAQMQRVCAELGVPREKMVFVSGIGCSSRFPYYMNTYGFHTIHGRAPALATGIKCANPDLQVWVMTGDGDGLSIGGNHLLHTLRRNLDLKIVLFNNRIYGLTKGQTSPTSEMGKITKSTPIGSIEHPIQPVAFALAAEATFVARTIDGEPQHMQQILKRAAMHKGVAFVEVFQNCNIFNDGAWDYLTAKGIRDDRVIELKHGAPMRFGKTLEKGLRLNGFRLEAVELGGGITENDLLVHNEKDEDSSLAFLLSRENERLPIPIGVFRSVEHPTYDGLLRAQIDDYTAKRGKGDLKKLIYSGQRWTVDA